MRQVKTYNGIESMESYCKRLSKKNNSILYLLEDYIGHSLLSDEKLVHIRDLVLTVSADIERLNSLIVECDTHEGL